MPSGVAERSKVGRKKKAVPSDYVNVKIPRDVHALAQIIVALSAEKPKPEIAQLIGNAARPALQAEADELYKASKIARP